MHPLGKCSKEDQANIAQLNEKGIEVKDGQKYDCRFGYPKRLVGYEHFYEEAQNGVDFISNSHRLPEYAPDGACVGSAKEKQTKKDILMLRNHPTINNHIPEILVIHRGGTNIHQKGPGGTREDQEGPGGTRGGQKGPGGTRKNFYVF